MLSHTHPSIGGCLHQRACDRKISEACLQVSAAPAFFAPLKCNIRSAEMPYIEKSPAWSSAVPCFFSAPRRPRNNLVDQREAGNPAGLDGKASAKFRGHARPFSAQQRRLAQQRLAAEWEICLLLGTNFLECD